MNLYIQLTNLVLYVESCKILEQTENQIILDYIVSWSTELKKELASHEINAYKNPTIIGPMEERDHHISLCEKCKRFLTIEKNSQYIPIQPPLFALKSMVNEIERNRLKNERKIFFKNIPKFNFTESRLGEPEFNNKIKRELTKKLGERPTVLSMAVIYQSNPLMWPLLFHEYGHAEYDEMCKTGLFFEGRFGAAHTVAAQEGVPTKYLDDWISEIFSDLFALRYYGSNYFFAFCFHVILSCNDKELLHLDEDDRIKKSQHPPPYIRLKYLIKAYQKNSFSNEDIAFNKLVEYLSPLISKLDKIVDSQDTKYKSCLKVFDTIADECPKFIKADEFPINIELIKKLENKLKQKHPIGTIFNGSNEEYAIKLRSANESFDLDSPTKISDIIFAGWSTLINYHFARFYENQNTYPLFDASKKPKENFSGEYIFFIRNITYSIETSVIVSSYKEAENA